jgi:hypothetical protein
MEGRGADWPAVVNQDPQSFGRYAGARAEIALGKAGIGD